MIHSPCNQCGQEATYPDVFGGQKLKCKLCPDGWVTLPQLEGIVPAVAPTLPPAPAPISPPSDAPPPRKYEPTTVWERAILRNTERTIREKYEDPESVYNWTSSAFIVIACIGFGSMILRVFGIQYRVMSGLESTQPFSGLVTGCIGLGLLFWWQRRNRA